MRYDSSGEKLKNEKDENFWKSAKIFSQSLQRKKLQRFENHGCRVGTLLFSKLPNSKLRFSITTKYFLTQFQTSCPKIILKQ